jgi:hypothetical protein
MNSHPTITHRWSQRLTSSWVGHEPSVTVHGAFPYFCHGHGAMRSVQLRRQTVLLPPNERRACPPRQVSSSMGSTVAQSHLFLRN